VTRGPRPARPPSRRDQGALFVRARSSFSEDEEELAPLSAFCSAAFGFRVVRAWCGTREREEEEEREREREKKKKKKKKRERERERERERQQSGRVQTRTAPSWTRTKRAFINGQLTGKRIRRAKRGTAVDQWGWDSREMWRDSVAVTGRHTISGDHCTRVDSSCCRRRPETSQSDIVNMLRAEDW
jgi:hypothetical protein